MVKLCPDTTYTFSPKDMEFVNELAKAGYVHLLSHQVLLLSEHVKGILFKHHSGCAERNCPGLTLPDGWVIESIYEDGGYIRMTFGVGREEMP